MQIKNTDDSLDYLDLPPEVVDKVMKHTTKIRGLLKAASENIIETGLELIDAKESVGHGKFEQWLDSQFGLGERTARKMMAVGRQFKTAQYADLQLAPSALYLLAAPSTPEAVREQFVEKAKTAPVAHKEVKQAIDTAKKTKKAKTKKKPAAPAKKKKPPPEENHGDFKVPKKEKKMRGKGLMISVRDMIGNTHYKMYNKQLPWRAEAPHLNHFIGKLIEKMIDSHQTEMLSMLRDVIDLLCDLIKEKKIKEKFTPATLAVQWSNLVQELDREETKRLAEGVGKKKQGEMFK